jgi:hypothetical protein
MIRCCCSTTVRLFCLLLAAARITAAGAADVQTPVHGLWIWKSEAVLQSPQAAAAIRDFCHSADITEVYVAVQRHYSALDALRLTDLIALLHPSGVRVEALISSVDGDEVGGPRTKLIDHVQSIVQFDRQHPAQAFDGIHLDLEPQQRAENKGAGNLQFVPGLIDTYRAIRVLTDRAGLTLNADIARKVLEADRDQRRLLLSAVPRLTLMLYELNTANAPGTTQQIETLRQASRRFLEMAYQGLDEPKLARMAIALRTPDYGPLLPQMLAALDEANRGNPHYLGWARHSYNDVLEGTPTAAARSRP